MDKGLKDYTADSSQVCVTTPWFARLWTTVALVPGLADRVMLVPVVTNVPANVQPVWTVNVAEPAPLAGANVEATNALGNGAALASSNCKMPVAVPVTLQDEISL